MENIFNQANLQKAGAFLDSENGKKAEQFVQQKTGIDVSQYTSGLSGNNSNNSNQDGQQAQGKPQQNDSSSTELASEPEYGTKPNVQQSSAGNYADHDDSTSSGGYGGDPFSRSAQTGGDDAQSRGQFGGDSKQEESQAYRGGSDSQGHSRSGSDYGSGATTPFEQKTGGFSAISSGNFQQKDEDGRQSSDNVGA